MGLRKYASLESAPLPVGISETPRCRQAPSTCRAPAVGRAGRGAHGQVKIPSNPHSGRTRHPRPFQGIGDPPVGGVGSSRQKQVPTWKLPSIVSRPTREIAGRGGNGLRGAPLGAPKWRLICGFTFSWSGGRGAEVKHLGATHIASRLRSCVAPRAREARMAAARQAVRHRGGTHKSPPRPDTPAAGWRRTSPGAIPRC